MWVWGAVLAVLVIVTVVVVYLSQRGSSLLIKKIDSQPSETRFYSVLSGLPVAFEAEVRPTVVGVMIDNNSGARPQSGLNQASIVYEAPVEGSITRYFALFNAAEPVVEVGPVRSARPYFLDWLHEYGDALYVHSGGSPEALRLIQTRDVFDANEFYFGQYFWRDRGRPAPHNLFTNQEGWQNILTKKQSTRPSPTVSWEGWKFDMPGNEPAPGQTPLPSAVSLRYTSSYAISWEVVTSTGRFVRSLNNRPMLLRGGERVEADSVVFMNTDKKVLDNEGRLAITTVSNGDALVLKRGALVRGTWKKTSLDSRTRFYDEGGQEIALTPGHIWIQVVPPEAVISLESGG